jgi:hypothetical protein
MKKQVNFGKVVILLCLSLLILITILWVFDKPNKYEEPQSERVADLVLNYWIPKTEAGVGPGGFGLSDAECVIEPDYTEVLVEFRGLDPTNDIILISKEMSDKIKSNYKLIGFLSISVYGKCMKDIPMDEIQKVAAERAMQAGADALEQEGLIAKHYKGSTTIGGTLMYSLYIKDGYDTKVIELDNSTVTVPCEMVVRSTLLDKEEKFEKTPNVYLAPVDQEDFIRSTFSMIGYISVTVTGDCVDDTTVQDTFDVAKQEAMKIGADVITVPKYGDNSEEDNTFFFYWCYKKREKSPFKPYRAEPLENGDYYEMNTNREWDI